MNVGIRTLGRKCFRWIYVGGQRRKACWFEVVRHELHPTKGWRLLRRARKFVPEHIWNKAPATEERFERTARYKARESLKTLSETDMEKARLRHAWYRREKARETFRARLPAANVHPDYHTDAQRGQLKAENGLEVN